MQFSFINSPLKSFFLLKSLPILLAAAVCTIATDVYAQTPSLSPVQDSTPAVSEQQQVIAERFFDLVAAGKFAEARQYLHPQLAAEWTPEVMQTRWQSFQDRTGKFVRRLNSRTIDQLVLITVEFTNVTDDVIFIFDHNQKIVGIDFPLQPPEIINQ